MLNYAISTNSPILDFQVVQDMVQQQGIPQELFLRMLYDYRDLSILSFDSERTKVIELSGSLI